MILCTKFFVVYYRQVVRSGAIARGAADAAGGGFPPLQGGRHAERAGGGAVRAKGRRENHEKN